MRKFNVLFIFILILSSLQTLPNYVFADNSVLNEYENEAMITANDKEDESVNLYEDEEGQVKLTEIPVQSTVYYISFNEDDLFVQIAYFDEGQDEIIEGYIETDYLSMKEQNDVENNKKIEQEAKEQSEEANESTEENEKDDDFALKHQEVKEDEKTTRSHDEREKSEVKSTAKSTQASSKRLEGVALKSRTNVYKEKSTDARVLKDYRQGHILIFRKDHDDKWYKATVYINGVAHNGYIYAEDVDVIDGNETKKEGQALLPTVSVYDRPSKEEGKVLKSYPYGTTLIYRTFSSKWHLATVFINGERHTGYIYDQDISPAVQGEGVGERLSGIGLKNPTNVYESMSRSSNVLKSYRQGHILKYRKYESSWYIATVYVDGKAKTGYIHHDDVGDPDQSLKGIAQKAPTHVYSDTSRNASILKSYAAGHELIYRPHDNNWFSATVYINGKRHSGYIHHDDVGDSIPSIEKYALKQPTHVYSSMSRDSQPLKSYKQGHLLKFKPYEKNWYRATVYVNGEAKTGYIHHDDVGDDKPAPSNRTVVIDAGHGGKDPGTSANGIVEKSLALSLSKLTRKMLLDAGINVIMTRNTDEYLTLAERSQIANNSNADLFLSIHGNAFNGSASGIETYWYDKYQATESKKLAEAIQKEVIRETKARDRGVKKGNFHVIRETKIPSALLEVGFLDHKEEAEKLKQEKYQKRLTQGIVNGILSYLE